MTVLGIDMGSVDGDRTVLMLQHDGVFIHAQEIDLMKHVSFDINPKSPVPCPANNIIR